MDDAMIAGLVADNATLLAQVQRLLSPFRAVDEQDWQFLMGAIPDGGRGRFWKEVLGEMRVALAETA